MGRTVPTLRNLWEQMEAEWQEFRRALRAGDQVHFDRIMERARRHASAASYGLRLSPVESLFFAVLLEQEKEIDALKRRLDEGAAAGR